MSSRFTRRAFIGGAAILALGGAASVRIWQSSRDEKKTRWTIGFSNAWETNTWRTALREPIQEEADRHQDVRLFITDAHDSPSKQVADLEDLLAKGVEGLIIGAATADDESGRIFLNGQQVRIDSRATPCPGGSRIWPRIVTGRV